MLEIESMVADAAYLQALEGKQRSRDLKPVTLPEQKEAMKLLPALQQEGGLAFDRLFDEPLGYHELRQFAINNGGMHRDLFMLHELNKQYVCAEEAQRPPLARLMFESHVYPHVLERPDARKHYKEALAAFLEEARCPTELFEGLLLKLKAEFGEALAAAFVQSPNCITYLQWKLAARQLSVSRDDFDLHRILGRGGFGEVFACQRAQTGKMYAAKELDKKRVKNKRAGKLAWNERNMLAQVGDSRFVVCLKYALQTPSTLYLVLDLMNGGDLAYHLARERDHGGGSGGSGGSGGDGGGGCGGSGGGSGGNGGNGGNGGFSEERAAFYAAQMLLGLEHMHGLRIVYRDMKPANILLDELGNCRISDLGLARVLNPGRLLRDETGTVGYMSPQTVRGEPYGFDADVWGLGVTLYEMLSGRAPFHVSSSTKKNRKEEMKRRTCEQEVKLPESTFSNAASSLLGKLLNRDPRARLGCGRRGIREAKRHRFFLNLNWVRLANGSFPPPWVPDKHTVHAKDVYDIDRFDSEETKKVKLEKEDQSYFDNYEMIVEEAWQQEMLDTVYAKVNAAHGQGGEMRTGRSNSSGSGSGSGSSAKKKSWFPFRPKSPNTNTDRKGGAGAGASAGGGGSGATLPVSSDLSDSLHVETSPLSRSYNGPLFSVFNKKGGSAGAGGADDAPLPAYSPLVSRAAIARAASDSDALERRAKKDKAKEKERAAAALAADGRGGDGAVDKEHSTERGMSAPGGLTGRSSSLSAADLTAD